MAATDIVTARRTLAATASETTSPDAPLRRPQPAGDWWSFPTGSAPIAAGKAEPGRAGGRDPRRARGNRRDLVRLQRQRLRTAEREPEDRDCRQRHRRDARPDAARFRGILHRLRQPRAVAAVSLPRRRWSGFRAATSPAICASTGNSRALWRRCCRRHDLVWVHDYHLIPLAEELRRLGLAAADRVFPAHAVSGRRDAARCCRTIASLSRRCAPTIWSGSRRYPTWTASATICCAGAVARNSGDGALPGLRPGRAGRGVSDRDRCRRDRGAGGESGRSVAAHAAAARQHPRPGADDRRRPAGLFEGAAGAVRGLFPPARTLSAKRAAARYSCRSRRRRARRFPNTRRSARAWKPPPATSTAASPSSTGRRCAI